MARKTLITMFVTQLSQLSLLLKEQPASSIIRAHPARRQRTRTQRTHRRERERSEGEGEGKLGLFLAPGSLAAGLAAGSPWGHHRPR